MYFIVYQNEDERYGATRVFWELWELRFLDITPIIIIIIIIIIFVLLVLGHVQTTNSVIFITKDVILRSEI